MTTKTRKAEPKATIENVELIPPQDVDPDPYFEDEDYDRANDAVDLDEAGKDLFEIPPVQGSRPMAVAMAGIMREVALATTSLALVGPHIQARGYTRGRSPMVERPGVNILIVHSAEGATDEIGLGQYFSRTTLGSSHGGIGQDGGWASYVNPGDTAWCAPPLNQEGEHVELCGFARWTREEWLRHPKMLETLARWIAWRCAVRRIPIVLLSDADVKAGKPGICDHDAVSNVWKKSTHWDVGENFPWDVVIPRAKQVAGVGGPTPPTAQYHTVVKGDTLTRIAAKYKTTVDALAAANGLKAPYTIYIGQRIKVAGAGSAPSPTRPPAPKPVTGVRGKFPYPADHYFYTTTADRRCHSGYGTEGADETYIRWIQQEVGATQDGEYGPNTRDKVYAWQGRVGLSKDGVFGPRSWARAAAS